MDKKDILKYLIGYIIIAMGIHYFFSKKSHEEEIGTLIHLDEGKITVNRPIELNINLLKLPIHKEFDIKKEEHDTSITCPTKTGEIVFSSFFGAPITVTYKHPITQKLISLFHEEKQEISPLLLVINGKAVTHYKEIPQEEKDTIVFVALNGKNTVRRTYKIKDDTVESTIDISGEKTESIESIQLVTEESDAIEQDQPMGFYSYHPEEKIIKLSAANQKPLLDAVILKPEMTGFQSTYFTQAIIQKNTFDRAFLDIKTNDAMEKKVYYFLEKTEFDRKSKDISLSFTWYCGIKNLSALKAADERLPLILEQGFFGKIAHILFSAITFFVTVFKNVGIAIILFSLGLKLITLPFLKKMKESSQISKEYQQKLEYIKTKYHDDPKRKSEEELLLIKKYGIFPGFMGWIPQILHIFVMISLPGFLKSQILFYQVPVGLWMTNASLPDQYFFLPLCCFIFAYLGIKDAKMTPMIKIAALILISIGMYAFSFLAAAMQVFVVTGLVLNYLEKKFLLA